MDKNFGEVHSKELEGSKIQAGGLPDHGAGRYTMAGGYATWMEFNKAQRVHYNYLEYINQMIPMFLLTGLYFPRAAAVTGGVYVAARIGY